jgi:hypothetical protein
MEEQFLSQEDLLSLRTIRQKLQIVELQRYAAELEVKNVLLQICLKYKLTEKDNIEESTGRIIKQA